MSLVCTTKGFAGNAVFTVSGRVDLANADELKDQLMKVVEAVTPTKGAVICDVTGLEYISSAGLRSFMIASKTAKPRGVTIAIAEMNPVIKEIFEISRFNLLFKCAPTVRLAVEMAVPASLAAYDAL